MPRKRLLAPEFFRDATLYKAERDSGLPVRLAFAGLWCYADRRGYFEWKPLELKAALFPFEQVDMAGTMLALCQHRVVHYWATEDGREFGAIKNFAKWQTFHGREKPNTHILEPQGFTLPPGASPVLAPVQHQSSTAVTVTGTGTGTGTNYRASARTAAPRNGKGSAGPKYPLYSPAHRDAALARWTQRVGPVPRDKIGAFHGALGPLFSSEGRAATITPFVLTEVISTYASKREIAFQSVHDLAAKFEHWYADYQRGRRDDGQVTA